MDINSLKSFLRSGKVTIEFTKVNGLRRVMVCTQAEGLIPGSTQSDVTRDANLLTVFDLEHQGWRTIKVDSIIRWNTGEGLLDKPADQTRPTENIGWTPKAPASPAIQ